VLSPGTRLGRYEIVSALGAGGMGEVYRARDVQLGRDVAVKIISAAPDQVSLARFEREARAAAALSHPAVLAVYDTGSHEGLPFIVTELLEGETLRARLARGPLALRAALGLAVQLAHGLAAAHSRGIVHRDLKPENLFLTSDGAAKILDFGLAKLVQPIGSSTAASTAATASQVTADGTVLGTAAYMSPEQASGGAADHRADQFAFGAVLFELFTGQRPFQRATVHETLAAILRDEPPGLTALRPDLPASAGRIVDRCLSKDPRGRYESTRDLALALEEVAAELTDRSIPRQPASPSSRPARRVALALAAVTAIVAAGLIWTWSGMRPDQPLAGGPSLVVLPFATIGETGDYFADGVTEAVTTEIGKVEGIIVIAANTSFSYRGRAADLREVARELRVPLVVTGSVQRAGARLRITASLIEARTGRTLWTDGYNRELIDVLAIQEDIARQIAGTLSARLAGQDTGQRQVATTSAAAYDAYLRGVAHLKGRSPLADRSGRLAAAVGELETAVSLDGKFAVARAVLASAYMHQFFYDAADPAVERKAFVEVEQALALNPDQAEAYLARAQLVWTLRNGFPHESAVADLRQALAINPNLAEAYVELGKIYYHVGLTEKAVEANERALRLDPAESSAARRRFLALADARRLDAVAAELARRPAWLSPVYHAEGLLALGRLDAAIGELAGAVEAEHTAPGARSYEADEPALLALAHARAGRRADAERLLAVVMPRAENPTGLSHVHHAQFHIGCALAVLGRGDEAVRWLTKAVNEGYPSYVRFSTEPSLSALKSPEFDALLERLRRDAERWGQVL
jgi:eukaryotic-like serine/threonine-protein kinase